MEVKTKKSSPKITQYITHNKTPFVVELTRKVLVPKPNHEIMEDKATGKQYGMYEIGTTRTVPHDPAIYSKLFKNVAKIMSALPDSSTKMFYYIHEHLGVGEDKICIHKDDYLLYYGYKPNNKFAYYQALEGLLEAGIIARIAGNNTCFYVNPNIIFNGDRTKLNNVVYVKPDDGYRLPNKSFRFDNNGNNIENDGQEE